MLHYSHASKTTPTQNSTFIPIRLERILSFRFTAASLLSVLCSVFPPVTKFVLRGHDSNPIVLHYQYC